MTAATVYRWPQVSGYAVSKAAVIKFTENLAVESRHTGVAVFELHPGTVPAGMPEDMLSADVPGDSHVGQVASWFRQQFALGRVSRPSARASSW